MYNKSVSTERILRVDVRILATFRIVFVYVPRYVTPNIIVKNKKECILL